MSCYANTTVIRSKPLHQDGAECLPADWADARTAAPRSDRFGDRQQHRCGQRPRRLCCLWPRAGLGGAALAGPPCVGFDPTPSLVDRAVRDTCRVADGQANKPQSRLASPMSTDLEASHRPLLGACRPSVPQLADGPRRTIRPIIAARRPLVASGPAVRCAVGTGSGRVVLRAWDRDQPDPTAAVVAGHNEPGDDGDRDSGSAPQMET